MNVTRSESDTALFFDLLYTGEFVTKLLVATTVAAVSDDRERQRYAVEYDVVRSDGIGDWVRALDELATGPVSQLLPDAMSLHKAELMQRFATHEESWQRQAVELLQQVVECFDSEVDPLPAKTSLQRWFHLFARLRNRTRGHGAAPSRICAEAAPNLERSLQLLTLRLGVFNLPWAYLRRSLTGKYRVVPLGGDAAPFEHLKRERDHSLEDGVYFALGSDLVRVGFLEADVDLSDFYLPNGNFRDSGFELLSYITDDVRHGDSSVYMTPASALPASGTAAGPLLDIVGNSFANLPPTIPDYVERAELEDSLEKLLLDDRHPVVTLVGRGGVGKTSLGLQVLHRVAEQGEYFAVIWFSARDIDLLPEGPKRVQPDVLTPKDIAAQFTSLMNPAGSAAKSFDAVDYLGRSMTGTGSEGPFLFVFDNFETVRSPGDLYNMIDSYIRLPNKVLITSRARDFKGDYPVEVRGMSRQEFNELAMSTAHRLGVGSKLSERFMDELFEESDGHPYVVKVLLGEVARRGKAASVERVMASRDDILEALFERTFSALPPAAQRVFLTLCNWRSTVPRLAIAAAMLRPSNERLDVEEALDTLETTSMIEVIGSGSAADQEIRVPLAAAVFGRRKLTASSMKTAVEADTEVMRLFGPARAGAASGFEERVRKVVAALAVDFQRGEIPDEISILEFVARQYPRTWLFIADLFEELPDLREGTKRAAANVQLYLEHHPEDITAWRRLASLAERAGDVVLELHARFEVVESGTEPVRDVSSVAARFNTLAANRKLNITSDERRAMAAKIRKLLEPHAPGADATLLSRLAWICLHLNDEPAARNYTRQGLIQEPLNQHCLSLSRRLQLEP